MSSYGGSAYVDMESGLPGISSSPSPLVAASRSRKRGDHSHHPPLMRTPIDEDTDDEDEAGRRGRAARPYTIAKIRARVMAEPRKAGAILAAVILILYLILPRPNSLSSSDASDRAIRLDEDFHPGPLRWNIAHPYWQDVAPLPPLTAADVSAPLTIFSTLRDLTVAYQRTNPAEYIKTWNALQSWMRLAGAPAILLFVDHADETCRHLRVDKQLNMSRIKCLSLPCFSKEFRKPFMHCIWSKALSEAATDHLTFVNGDIVLLDDFMTTFHQVSHHTPHMMMVAQRTDVAYMDWPKTKLKYFIQLVDARSDDEDIGLSDGAPAGTLIYEYNYDDPVWLAAFKKHVRTHGVQHSDSGIDMFTFHRSLMNRITFPPFLVGVYRWDNWLLAELLLRSDYTDYDRHLGLTPLGGGDDEGYLVFDATRAITLVHDSTRSDHIHDLGAAYNDELVKARIGLRYKLGRIGNADVVVTRTTIATTADAAAAPTPPVASPLSKSASATPAPTPAPEFLSTITLAWSTADRLDLLLARSATPTGLVGLLQVSSSYLSPLLDNFLCWSRGRGGFDSMMILAEDIATFKKVWHDQQGGTGAPVILLKRNGTIEGHSEVRPEMPESPDQAQAVAYAARHHTISRVLEHGFNPLLVDLDSWWLSNPIDPLGALIRLHARVKSLDAPKLYQDEYDEGHGIRVPHCTIVATTREVLLKPANTPQGTSIYQELLSTSFMYLHANKFSRFFLKRLGECTQNILANYPTVRTTDTSKAPCRYIEERCAHDLLGTMRNDLSKEALADFKICPVPKEMFIDTNRFRVGPGQTNTWPYKNDPTARMPTMPTELTPEATKLLSLLPPGRLVLGVSGNGIGSTAASGGGRRGEPDSIHVHPILMHDFAPSTVVSLDDKLSHWNRSGLMCQLQSTSPKRRRELDDASSLAPPLAPLTTPGFLVRVMVHLAPSSRFTRAAFERFLAALERATYRPVDLIDVHFDVGPFYAPEELAKDRRRKRLMATRRRAAGIATEEDRAILAEVDARAPGTAHADGPSLAANDPSSSFTAAELDPSSDPLIWSLTLSDVESIFRDWKWLHGMKSLFLNNIPLYNPLWTGEEDRNTPSSPNVASSGSAVATGGVGVKQSMHAKVVDEQRADALHMRVRSTEDGQVDQEWIVHSTFKDTQAPSATTSPPSSATSTAPKPPINQDVPVLLLDPFTLVHPSWHVWSRSQFSSWSKRSTLDVDRRWVGLSLLPLVTQLSAHDEPDSYPPTDSLMAAHTRTALTPISRTAALRLIGDSYTFAEAERIDEELKPGGGNETISGRLLSAVYRTQLFNPLGSILFSSTVSAFALWRKQQLSLTVGGGDHPLKVPTCWNRPQPGTGLLHPHTEQPAFIRFMYETGSFVTAPAITDGNKRISALVTDVATEPPNAVPPVTLPLDPALMRTPARLAQVPLFDLSGASVPLPDTLAYRHLLLKAAHQAAPLDRAACAWPAMHPKMTKAFGIDLAPFN